VEALLSAHGIASSIEALTNSQALYLGSFAHVDALRNRLAAEGQGGFDGGNSGLSSQQKAEDHGELTRLRGRSSVCRWLKRSQQATIIRRAMIAEAA
jgi:hypothetical protein